MPVGALVRMRSVDDWPMAKILSRFLGVSLGRYPLTPVDVTGLGRPPLEGCMSQSRCGHLTREFLWRTIPWGTQWGQLDGRSGPPPPRGAGCLSSVGRCLFFQARPCHGVTLTSTLFRGGRVACRDGGCPGAPPDPASTSKIVTWLILPVVICLSQRLSHACPSISTHTVKLRMAH
jgi:hypothetical protein